MKKIQFIQTRKIGLDIFRPAFGRPSTRIGTRVGGASGSRPPSMRPYGPLLRRSPCPLRVGDIGRLAGLFSRLGRPCLCVRSLLYISIAASAIIYTITLGLHAFASLRGSGVTLTIYSIVRTPCQQKSAGCSEIDLKGLNVDSSALGAWGVG